MAMTPADVAAYRKAYNAAHVEERRVARHAYYLKHQDAERAASIARRRADPVHASAILRASRVKHADRVRARWQAYHKAHEARLRTAHQAWCLTHADQIKAQQERYRLVNKERRLAAGRARRASPRGRAVLKRRRAAKRQAMPAWANRDAIGALYVEAARLTRATGVKHVVDHVYPLLGRTVSGLHVEANLQILTALANAQKGNKHPDWIGT